MKKQAILIIFLASLSTYSFGQLKVDQIHESIFHVSIEGGESTLKASIIREGNDAVLVDLMNAEFGQAIKSYTEEHGLNVKLIINTHYHGDHSGGNTAFGDIPILAHQNTLMNIENGAPFGPPSPEESKPTMLFENHFSYFLGKTKIEVFHFGPAHTSGDAIVYVPNANVVMVGDVMLDAKYTLPFAPNPEGLLSVLKKIEEKINAQTKVITGHGQIGTKGDLMNLIEIMELTIDHAKSGKDVGNYPKEWNAWDSQYLSMQNWLKMLGRMYGN